MDERRGDWVHGVDENLASLNAGQRIWEREQKTLRKALSEVDSLLRGDTEKETDGLIARMHLQETELNRIRAVLFKSATGSGGLIEDVKTLREGREERRSYRGDVVKVIVAIITSGAVGLFWHDIVRLWARTPDPIQQLTPHTKVRHRHVVVRQDPPDEQAE